MAGSRLRLLEKGQKALRGKLRRRPYRRLSSQLMICTLKPTPIERAGIRAAIMTQRTNQIERLGFQDWERGTSDQGPADLPARLATLVNKLRPRAASNRLEICSLREQKKSSDRRKRVSQVIEEERDQPSAIGRLRCPQGHNSQ